MPSKCSDSNLETLVSDGLLPEKSVIQWRPALGEDCPYENTGEIITFAPYLERGLGLPCSFFFSGLLCYYRIQLHHLTPNSFVHISIFVHLCEAFLGIEPHFELFRFLFHLKQQPDSNVLDVVGGAGLQLRQGVGVYRQACSRIPLAVRFVGRDRWLWNSMVQGTQRFRQVRVASCVIPYILCGGLYCLRC